MSNHVALADRGRLAAGCSLFDGTPDVCERQWAKIKCIWLRSVSKLALHCEPYRVAFRMSLTTTDYKDHFVCYRAKVIVYRATMRRPVQRRSEVLVLILHGYKG